MFKRPDWMDFGEFKEKRKGAIKILKNYLKGRIIKGTESYYTPKTSRYRGTFRQQKSESFLLKKKKQRKIKNKMARRSRRVNRLRNT